MTGGQAGEGEERAKKMRKRNRHVTQHSVGSAEKYNSAEKQVFSDDGESIKRRLFSVAKIGRDQKCGDRTVSRKICDSTGKKYSSIEKTHLKADPWDIKFVSSK